MAPGASARVLLVADHDTREGAAATTVSALRLGLDVVVATLCGCAAPDPAPSARSDGPTVLVVPADRLDGWAAAVRTMDREGLAAWALPRLVAGRLDLLDTPDRPDRLADAVPLLALAAGVELRALPHDLLGVAAGSGVVVATPSVVALDPRHDRTRGLVGEWVADTAHWRTASAGTGRLATRSASPPPASGAVPAPDDPWLDLSRTSSATPWLLDARADPPRVLLSERPDLAAQVRDALARRPTPTPVPDHPADGSLLPDGVRLDPVVRRALREAADAGAPWPAAGQEADWLTAPRASGPPRLLAALRRCRPDLAAAHPQGPDGDAGLVEWARRHGRDDGSTDPALLTRAVERLDAHRAASPRSTGDLARRARSGVRSRARAGARRTLDAARSRLGREGPAAGDTGATPRTAGVNLVGYLRGELGIGESARLVHDALVEAGVPVVTRAVSLQLSSRERAGTDLDTSPAPLSHDTTLLAVNAAQTPALAALAGDDWAGTDRIGYWYWEVEDFPASEHGGFEHVDEVWVATDFVRRAVQPHSPVPVVTLTPPLWRETTPPAREEARARLGLPADRPVVLFVFDHLSGAERKNPWGAVEAFRRALAAARPTGARPLLVLKSMNAERRLRDAERLRLLVAGDPDVVLLEQYLESADLAALMASCDVYLSLHRAEGLGLTVAEAMAHGTPVVVTAYGGTEEFVDDDVARRVPWEPVPIPDGCPPYPAGGRWAEPDLDAAAAALVALWEDPAAARALGTRGAAHLRAHHDAATAGAAMRARLEQRRG